MDESAKIEPSLEEIVDEVEEFFYEQPEETRAEALEAKAAALDPGAPARAQYLTQAAEAYEGRRLLDDALRCLLAAQDDGGPTWLDIRALLVSLHLAREEDEQADELARELRRSLDTLVDFDGTLAWLGEAFEEVGRPREAQRWFTVGLRDIDPEDLDEEDRWALPLLNGRSRVRRALGLGYDGYDRAGERVAEGLRELRRRTDGEWALPEDVTGVQTWALIHWPEPEFSAFAARWPHLTEGYGGTFDQHRIETEQHLRQYASIGADVSVAMASLTELLDYAEDKQVDPTLGSTRAAYAAEIARTGRAVPWPPGLNEPCWCGSSKTYRSCCRRHPDRPLDP